MKTAKRMEHLAWKSMQKNIVSNIRNEKRSKAAQLKWSRQKATWHHLHPKR